MTSPAPDRILASSTRPLPADALRAHLETILDGRPLPAGARGALVLEVLRLQEVEREVRSPVVREVRASWTPR